MMKDQVFFNSLVNTHHQSKKTSKIVSKKYDSKTSEHENTINSKLIMQTSNNFNKKKFKNIFDLLEDLKKLRLINASVWEILCLGVYY